MFSKILKGFHGRGGKRMIVAAAVCAVGLGIGFGGGSLLAQLTGPNPTSNVEAEQCCEPIDGCPFSCYNFGIAGSIETTNMQYYCGCSVNSVSTQPCSSTTKEVICGLTQQFIGPDCKGGPIEANWAYHIECAQNPPCSKCIFEQ